MARRLHPAIQVVGPTDKNPDVSFIICTKNRSTQLLRCLDSILRAARGHRSSYIEIVVVDNGSVDQTQALLIEFSRTCPVPLRSIYEASPGLANARNAGVAQSSGALLVFTDDDCEVDLDYVGNLAQLGKGSSLHIVRGGRVELGRLDDMPLTIKLSKALERYVGYQFPGGFILGCNLVISREVLRSVGPFDNRFGAGGPLRSAEDTDFILRAFLSGIPVEYVPDLCVYHNHRRKTIEDVRPVIEGYAYGNGGIYAKYGFRQPWLLRNLYWTLRDASGEGVGKTPYFSQFGISNWRIFAFNISGALKFFFLSIAGLRSAGRSGAVR